MFSLTHSKTKFLSFCYKSRERKKKKKRVFLFLETSLSLPFGCNKVSSEEFMQISPLLIEIRRARQEYVGYASFANFLAQERYPLPPSPPPLYRCSCYTCNDFKPCYYEHILATQRLFCKDILLDSGQTEGLAIIWHNMIL